MSPETQQNVTPPSALVFIGPGCPHCAQVLQGLQELVKEGALARLEIVNIAVDPEPAVTRGVRSVPWTRIGPFVLEGAHSPVELRNWASQTQSIDGMAWYFDEQLKSGRLERVESMVREQPSRLEAIAKLAADTDTAMQTRVGIAALLESLEGSGLAKQLALPLSKLVQHPDARVRADACHYLSLTENSDSIAYLEPCRHDQDPVVRDIAVEGIEHLKEGLGEPDV
jgi:thiol-disulfide isomerase/thioredoxin